jgi:hypothetical protein
VAGNVKYNIPFGGTPTSSFPLLQHTHLLT